MELLDYLPNEFSTRLPVVDINFSTRTLSVSSKQSRDSYDPSSLVDLVNLTINEINEYLERMVRTIAPLNAEIFNLARQSLYTRRKNLEATIRTSQAQGWKSGFDACAAAESLVKDSRLENNFANLTSLPPAGEVEKIREVIHRLAENIEGTNRFVRSLDEESLRDVLLLSLKSITENRADGEIFRRNGKTDILVSGERNAIFIAECKFWSGEKKYTETIDQILENYVTAKDRNIAILVFNRNKNALSVFNSLSKATQEHSAYLKTIEESTDKRRLDVEFQNPIDENVKMHCSIILYDLS